MARCLLQNVEVVRALVCQHAATLARPGPAPPPAVLQESGTKEMVKTCLSAYISSL